ncbi:MAG: response regulator [Deltaproteobacteria bacterium]|nr:response regulator [Deltaproteobacteria bacterium]
MATRSDRRKRLLAKFATVARERLTRMGELLAHLLEEGGDEEAVTTLMREIHTLKGESRLMGFGRVNELSHRTEDLLAWARDKAFQIDADASELITFGFDLMRKRVDDPDASEDDHTDEEKGYLASLAACLGEGEAAEGGPPEETPAAESAPPPKPEPAAPAPAPEPAMVKFSEPADDDEDSEPESSDEDSEPESSDEPTGRRTQAVLGRKRTRDFVRISNEEVAALTELSADLLSRQANIHATIEQLLARDRTALDRETASLIRALADASAEIGARIDALQGRVRHLRLHEVQDLFERYPPAIRELGREQGKRVKVVVEPTTVAVDRRVLETLDEAMLHLVRNSVDHGLESAEDRKRTGKKEFGTVTLSARPLGARVEVTIQDDGRGVDVDRVRAAAIERGKVGAAEAAELGEESILQLVFEPGLSTRETITDISGRGVGLDVVKRHVASLGGTVHLSTRPGQGTTFTMTLPVSASLAEVLIVRAGRSLYAVPSTQVERLIRVERPEIRQLGERSILEIDGEPLPLVSLRELMVGTRVGEPEVWPLSVAVLARAGKRLSVWVDQFLGEHRLVQHTLGDFLKGIRRVSGTVVAGEQDLALVVNVPEVLEHWGEGQTTMVTQEAAIVDTGRPTRILIVEDSELTRDMLVGLAERIGLETLEAVNGKDALSRVEKEPDLILTDLDMPVMDGFAFLEAFRARPDGKETPVIVLSTRGSDEDKRRAMAAGANAYVIKAEFSEATFRDLLSHFVALPQK